MLLQLSKELWTLAHAPLDSAVFGSRIRVPEGRVFAALRFRQQVRGPEGETNR